MYIDTCHVYMYLHLHIHTILLHKKTSPGFLKHHMKHDQFSRTISGTNAADAEAVGALSSRRSGASGAGDAIFRPAKVFCHHFWTGKNANIWRLKIRLYHFGTFKVGTRFSVKFGIDRCMESDLELSSLRFQITYMLLSHFVDVGGLPFSNPMYSRRCKGKAGPKSQHVFITKMNHFL